MVKPTYIGTIVLPIIFSNFTPRLTRGFFFVFSVVVTGYPAKYVNFRSPGDDYIREISKSQPSSGSGAGSLLGKFKFK